MGPSYMPNFPWRAISGEAGGGAYVARRETWTGQPQFVGSLSHRGEKVIVNEYVIDKLIAVPKKQITETLIEKTIVVPEVRLIEEYIQVPHTLREKIIEIATPYVRETVVERPEREVRETVVSERVSLRFPNSSKRVSAKPEAPARDSARAELKPRQQEARGEQKPRVEHKMSTPAKNPILSPEFDHAIAPAAEGPNRQYRKSSDLEITVPKIKAVWTQQPVPIRVPRFIETAIAAEKCDSPLLNSAANCDQGLLDTLASLSQTESTHAPTTAPTLSELDQCWQRIDDLHFEDQMLQQVAAQNIINWWNTNQLLIDSASIASVCAGTDSHGDQFVETVSVIRKRSHPPTTHCSDQSSSCLHDDDDDDGDDERDVDDLVAYPYSENYFR